MLFDLTELASYLQTDLDTASAQLAHDTAQGVIEGRIGQPVASATVTARLPVDCDDSGRRLVRLVGQPITDVAAVDGAASWEWDRFDTVYLTGCETSVLVTYTRGYATVPADLKAVALSLAARSYASPTGLVRSESVDDYRVEYDTSDGGGVALTGAEERILDRYRARVAVIGANR